MPVQHENTNQIKSRQRVADHGEVFTNPCEVNAMFDLVRDEPLRLDSRFLEPACGKTDFLIEILPDNAKVCRKQLYSEVAASVLLPPQLRKVFLLT